MNCKSLICALAIVLSGEAAIADGFRVTALGRLEPRDGVVRVAGPSHPSVVISKLMVGEGDHVDEGQVLAILDSYPVYNAAVVRLEAELQQARAEQVRYRSLSKDGIVSMSERENWETRVATIEADLDAARVQLDWTQVRSPITGQVLEIHTRAGERVGPDGIVELGRTHEMLAIAEVYETDVTKLEVGQAAEVRSPALAAPLSGKVERIGMKIGKMDVLGTDPTAQTDARVVEVEIRLDDSSRVASLTNLRVEVFIGPE